MMFIPGPRFLTHMGSDNLEVLEEMEGFPERGRLEVSQVKVPFLGDPFRTFYIISEFH